MRRIVWAALVAGCATRRVEDVSWEVEAAATRPVAVAIAAEPPLPGEALHGWEGLAEAGAAGAGTAGASAPTGTLTLDAALRLARARNASATSAGHEATVARWAARQAGRLPNPSVEIEAWPEGEDLEIEGGVEIGLTDIALAPVRGRTFAAAAEAERHRAEEAAARLAYDVRAAYYAAAAAEARLAVAQRALDGLAAARDVAVARAASGNAPTIEAAAHTAAFERARGDVAALELAREAARERLNTLLALTGAETGWTALEPLAAPDAPPDTSDATDRALRASHALAAARARLDSHARQGALARLERGVPDVSLALLGSWEGTPGARAEGEWRAGVGLHTTLPVFDGGRAEGRAWDARFDAEAARARGLVAEIASAVRVTRARLDTAHARAVHERDVALPAARRVTRETLLHYNAMQLGVYELLQARAAELSAELAHVDTLRELWTARAAWDALLAGGRVEGDADTGPIELGGASSAGGGH